MINGITFIVSGVEYHSWDDFHLIRTKKSIGKAEIKKYEVNIEGADGVLDLTSYFGEPKYKNRPLQFEFECIEDISTFDDLYSDIQNALHGQEAKIILDDDPEFYYEGRIDVGAWSTNKRIGSVSIKVDAKPYKLKLNPTVIENVVNGSATLSFENMRKNVVPTIYTTAAINIVFGTSTFSLNAGTYVMPDMVFVEGTNTMTVTGTATVKVTYQEGGL